MAIPERWLTGALLLGLLAVGCSPPAPVARSSPVAVTTPTPKVASSSPSPVVAGVTGAPVGQPALSPSPFAVVPPSTPTPTPSSDFALGSTVGPESRLALRLPGPAETSFSEGSRLKPLLAQAEESGMAAHWRKVGEKALELKLYTQASNAFRREAGIYRSKGLLQAALAQESRAGQYSTNLTLYLGQSEEKSPASLERLEPRSGCYVGAFIDRDDNLNKLRFASQTHGDVDEFHGLTDKEHASFFMYRSYGEPFPREWAEYLKERGAIVHIAWEPRSLDHVKDDAYLREFVDQIVSLDHPVMLRFASEMNGDWTPYHGRPEAYKAAFRLVHAATRRAPKAALMWCPNTVPRQGVEDYYPGDDAVDWVGVNFYSVPFLDNDRARSGKRIHPTDHLEWIYNLYSARKPIAIGEWAASRQSSALAEPIPEFAANKLGQLYGTLPTRYPRVKMVNWYDSNNLLEARPGRQLNNYQVTEPPSLLANYRKAVSSSYYLGAGQSSSPLVYGPLIGGAAVSEKSVFRISLHCYDQHPKVYFRVNGAVVLATDDPLDWWLPSSTWKVGANKVEVLVFDSENRFVIRKSAVLKLPREK